MLGRNNFKVSNGNVSLVTYQGKGLFKTRFLSKNSFVVHRFLCELQGPSEAMSWSLRKYLFWKYVRILKNYSTYFQSDGLIYTLVMKVLDCCTWLCKANSEERWFRDKFDERGNFTNRHILKEVDERAGNQVPNLLRLTRMFYIVHLWML